MCMIFKYCFKFYIVVVIFNEYVYCGLVFLWGVYFCLVILVSNIDEMFDFVVKEFFVFGVVK